MYHTVLFRLSSKPLWPNFMHLCSSLKHIFSDYETLSTEKHKLPLYSLFLIANIGPVSVREPAVVSVFYLKCRLRLTKDFF